MRKERTNAEKIDGLRPLYRKMKESKKENRGKERTKVQIREPKPLYPQKKRTWKKNKKSVNSKGDYRKGTHSDSYIKK